MQGERRRQHDNIELIASENYVSAAVMEAQGSWLTNKYAEGLPGKRYYGGCEFVDIAETLAQERALALYPGAEHVNVQPHSGAQANMAAYFSVLQPGDRILGMNLAHGGHLTHGMKLNFSGKLYEVHAYGVRQGDERIDYDAMEAQAKEVRPKLIVAGASAYPRLWDFERMADIAHGVGAILFVDMAHIAGLVAAGVHPSPFPHADIVTTTTHKTLRGPRGGLIFSRLELPSGIDAAAFPNVKTTLAATIGLAVVVQRPDTPFWILLLVASTAGLGGGNFASSMTNISYFFPEKEKGWALGLNAAGGNIGVAVVQAPFVVTAVVTAGGGLILWRAGVMWVPLILLAAFLAWKAMDNLSTAQADFSTSAAAAKRPHTWVMAFLYIGTFGSFMGYAAAFPMLIKMEFVEVNPTSWAFLGALVGSLARPFGGRLSDRVGGAVVTAASFVVMGVGVLSAVFALRAGSFGLFLCAFLVLFVATGVSNGSTYRMIPAIFRATADEGAEGTVRAKREAAAAIGIISAVGAFGGFFVPRIYSWASEATGSIEPAMFAT